MTQTELATELGVSLKTLQRYEQNLQVPRRAVLLGWATTCDVDLDWIIAHDG